MSDVTIITQYVGACLSGTIASSECGPVWYMAGIGLLVVGGIVLLVAMRANAKPTGGARR